MSNTHQQYVSLDTVVNMYLDRSEQPIQKYYKCWQLAFSGMEELGLDFFYQIKSVKLPVLQNLTVSLPDDYLKYTKVGVLNSKGEIIPIAYNDKLTTYSDLSPNRIQQTEDNTIADLIQFATPIWYNYWSNGVFAPLYGLPSGTPFIGNFKIDDHNGVLLLNENFGYEYIMLEYLAAPKQGEEYYLPIQFKTALMWYIAYNDIAFMPNSRKGNLGDKEQRRRQYYNERRLAQARYKPVDLESAYQWSMESQRLTVKI
jgi:hypothetical protein